jgi:glycosyltransferase involved in cell wall biosynthesis
MNILIATVYLPFPLDSGGKLAQFHIIDSLRKKHNITLIALVGDLESLTHLNKIWAEVRIIVAHSKTQNGVNKALRKKIKNILVYGTMQFRKIRHIISHTWPKAEGIDLKNPPPGLTLFWDSFIVKDPVFYEIFYRHVQQNKYDLVQIDFLQLIGLIYLLPSSQKKIFVHYEIRFIRAQRELKTIHQEDSPYLQMLIKMIKDQEISLLKKFDAIVTFSDVDKEFLMQDICSTPIYVSPFPVEIGALKEIDRYNFCNKITFLGGEEHYPNYDGIDWFINNIWPAISNKYPAIKFVIIGHWKHETKIKYGNKKNVEFAGFVENLSDVISGSIMVVPLRIGSGIRMKILDAISLNVPVISTSIGAEGLKLEPSQDILIADKEEDIIGALSKLIMDKDLQVKLINQAKTKIISYYSKEHCSQTRERIYNWVVSKEEMNLNPESPNRIG